MKRAQQPFGTLYGADHPSEHVLRALIESDMWDEPDGPEQLLELDEMSLHAVCGGAFVDAVHDLRQAAACFLQDALTVR